MRTAMITSMLAALVLACGGDEPAARQATAQAETAVREAPQKDVPPAAETASKSELGVAECDAYVEKFLACIDKVPAQAQAAVHQGFEQSRAAWQQAAATPEGRASLAMACRQADEAARRGMQAYGCAW